MKYCSNCGKQLPDNVNFCTACGTAVSAAPSAPSVSPATPPAAPSAVEPQSTPPPVAPATGAIYDEESLKQGIQLCTDGKYRWIHEMNLWKNPTIVILLCKVFFWIAIGMWVFAFIVNLCHNGWEWESLVEAMMVPLIVMGVFAFIVPFAYVIVALINGGKFIYLYEMDEKGVLQRQLKAETSKAIAWIAAMAGLGTGNLSMAGAGIAAATSTTLYITFGSVKSIKPKPKHNVIHIRETLTLYQVYVNAAEFDFVLDYIRAHSPKVK